MKKISPEVLKLIEKNESFCMATLITRDGSAPRGPGAKMIIRSDSSISGTIGGGLLEAEVIRRSKDVFSMKKAKIEEFHLSGDDFATIDMTCGGDVEVLIDYIDALDPKNRQIFQYISDNSDKKEKAFLVTIIPSGTETGNKGQFLILNDRSYIGNPPFDTKELLNEIPNIVRYKIVNLKDNFRLIVESINTLHYAYIFGAGHVGQKIAEFLKFVDFNVTVLDDRADFANTKRLPFADKVYLIDSFKSNIDFLNIDKYSYIIIVTRGHTNDANVLRLSLKTEAVYIGMIGSKKKRNIIYNNLRKEGFSKQDLARVYAPIGLEIGAETPEEIAVSIAAEMIKVRSEISEIG